MSNAKEMLWNLLYKRYPKGEYVLLPEVRNDAGGYASRSADGVAFNMWPSRGLAVEGIEIKSYRSDWLNELKNPRKAEAIFQYCDYWWLVTDKEGVAKIEEIPETWGWMCVVKGRLMTMKKAPKLNPAPLTRGIIASMLRRATDGLIHQSTIQSKVDEAFEKGKNSVRIGGWEKMYNDLKYSLDEFERESGVKIDTWRAGDIGKKVKFLIQEHEDVFSNHMNNLKKRAEKILQQIEEYNQEEHKTTEYDTEKLQNR